MYASSLSEEREKCKTGGDAASMEGSNGVLKALTPLLLQNLKATQAEFCPAGTALFSTHLCLLGLWAWDCSVYKWEVGTLHFLETGGRFGVKASERSW